MNRSNLKFLSRLVAAGYIEESIATNIIAATFLGVKEKKNHKSDRLKIAKSTPKELTVSEWLAKMRAAQIGEGSELKTQTVRNKKAIFNHIERLWGDLELSALKPMQITADLKGLAATKPSAAQRVLAELKQLYSEAMSNELVQTNPAMNVKCIRVRVKRKRLSFEVYQGMLDAANKKKPWVKCMLLLALITGQRRADLAEMKFSDIKDGYLHVEQQKEAGKGYGARVAIPLDLELESIGVTLGKVVKLCRRAGKPGDYMLRKDNGSALEVSSLSIQFSSLIREVVGQDVYAPSEWPSLHEIRSLSARLYKEQGIDTQTLLGHKNADMTSLYEDDRGLNAKEFKKVSAKPKKLEASGSSRLRQTRKDDDWASGF